MLILLICLGILSAKHVTVQSDHIFDFTFDHISKQLYFVFIQLFKNTFTHHIRYVTETIPCNIWDLDILVPTYGMECQR